MKTKLIILPVCILFLNASLFAFNRIAEEESIPVQKSNTKEDKKKLDAESKNEKENDTNSKDKSLKDKVKDKLKEKLKKNKEKKEGGRFGDRRF